MSGKCSILFDQNDSEKVDEIFGRLNAEYGGLDPKEIHSYIKNYTRTDAVMLLKNVPDNPVHRMSGKWVTNGDNAEELLGMPFVDIYDISDEPRAIDTELESLLSI